MPHSSAFARLPRIAVTAAVTRLRGLPHTRGCRCVCYARFTQFAVGLRTGGRATAFDLRYTWFHTTFPVLLPVRAFPGCHTPLRLITPPGARDFGLRCHAHIQRSCGGLRPFWLVLRICATCGCRTLPALPCAACAPARLVTQLRARAAVATHALRCLDTDARVLRAGYQLVITAPVIWFERLHHYGYHDLRGSAAYGLIDRFTRVTHLAFWFRLPARLPPLCRRDPTPHLTLWLRLLRYGWFWLRAVGCFTRCAGTVPGRYPGPSLPQDTAVCPSYGSVGRLLLPVTPYRTVDFAHVTLRFIAFTRLPLLVGHAVVYSSLRFVATPHPAPVTPSLV